MTKGVSEGFFDNLNTHQTVQGLKRYVLGDAKGQVRGVRSGEADYGKLRLIAVNYRQTGKKMSDLGGPAIRVDRALAVVRSP
jgi:hypothetical protein